MWNIGPIQIQAILYIYTKYIQNMYPKVELVEETKGGKKKKRKIVNNNEMYHIYVGTRHSKAH
jgi:hypothetical protein